VDAAKNRILGPALQWLHQHVLGHPVNEVAPKAAPVDAGPETPPLVPPQVPMSASMVDRVKSIRENLEEAIKTGKLKTVEDATNHAAKELIDSGLPVPTIEAAQGLTPRYAKQAENAANAPRLMVPFYSFVEPGLCDRKGVFTGGARGLTVVAESP
jgi:hypothetical protein